jgi:hypothetical protein
MFHDFFITYLEEKEMDIENIWFQQDVVAARILIDIIHFTFPGNLVSRNGNVPWPSW